MVVNFEVFVCPVAWRFQAYSVSLGGAAITATTKWVEVGERVAEGSCLLPYKDEPTMRRT